MLNKKLLREELASLDREFTPKDYFFFFSIKKNIIAEKLKESTFPKGANIEIGIIVLQRVRKVIL